MTSLLNLRDNVNLWGSPPAAVRAIAATAERSVAAYPDSRSCELTAEVARAVGVRPEEVIAGCGSDDVIDAFLRAAGRDVRIACPDPSFSMVPVFSRLNGLDPVLVPLRYDGAADIDGLLATRAPVIYLCSPNNPTGTVTPLAEVRRLIAGAPGLVLVDEAYAEFAGTDGLTGLMREAPAMRRVLVTRTFSKAWGLAGLRIGYGVGDRELIQRVLAARGPYKVNAVAEAAAVAALRGDGRWMAEATREAIESRDRLAAALGAAGMRRVRRVWPSRANFVLVSVVGSATELAQRFEERGVAVRAFSGLTGVGEALRVGVAPRAGLERAIAVAREVLG